MTLEIDVLNATVSALVPLTLSGVVIGIFKIAEFNEHKKTTEDWMQSTIKQMDKHEQNDAARQLEVLSRIEAAEKNILENWKEIVKK